MMVERIDVKARLIAAATLAGILSASPAAHALDSYRPYGAGPLICGNFARAVDGLDPRDKDSRKVTFTTTSIRNRLRFSMLPP